MLSIFNTNSALYGSVSYLTQYDHSYENDRGTRLIAPMRTITHRKMKKKTTLQLGKGASRAFGARGRFPRPPRGGCASPTPPRPDCLLLMFGSFFFWGRVGVLLDAVVSTFGPLMDSFRPSRRRRRTQRAKLYRKLLPRGL